MRSIQGQGEHCVFTFHSCHLAQVSITLGPAYNEFGCNEHPVLTLHLHGTIAVEWKKSTKP